MESGLAAARRLDTVDVDRRAAFDMYDVQCQEEEPHACVELARHLLAGNGVDVQVARGLILLADTCKGGDAEACTEAAEWKACIGGDAEACARLEARSALVEPEDPERAGLVRRKACFLGHRAACEALSEPRYQARACALAGRTGCPPIAPVDVISIAAACKRGEGRACLRLAEIYATGDGAPENDGHARELYARAAVLLARECENDGEACRLRARIAAYGDDGKVDTDTADIFNHRAAMRSH
jgi:TPR repeat protein